MPSRTPTPPPPSPNAPTRVASLDELRPDPLNANRGTERGRGLLEQSLRQYGAARSIVVDRHGVVIGGNKTLEVAVDVGLDEAIVVPSDGRRLVVVQRTDLDLADPRAQELALADNRIAQVSLDFDPAVLEQLAANGADLGKFWTGDELAALVGTTRDPGPQVEPELGSEVLITIRCSRAALETLQATLDEWSTRPNVTVDVS